jgi:hypothetical protein
MSRPRVCSCSLICFYTRTPMWSRSYIRPESRFALHPNYGTFWRSATFTSIQRTTPRRDARGKVSSTPTQPDTTFVIITYTDPKDRLSVCILSARRSHSKDPINRAQLTLSTCLVVRSGTPAADGNADAMGEPSASAVTIAQLTVLDSFA